MNPIFVNNSDLKVPKHELVTVTIPAGATKTQWNFPDLPNLRKVHLVSLEVWKFEAIEKTPDGTAVATIADLKKIFLTLEDYSGRQFLKDCPIRTFEYFVTSDGGGAVHPISNESYKKTFNKQRVNYPKSYINLANGFVPAAEFAVTLSVYYIDPAEIEAKERAATFEKRG